MEDLIQADKSGANQTQPNLRAVAEPSCHRGSSRHAPREPNKKPRKGNWTPGLGRGHKGAIIIAVAISDAKSVAMFPAGFSKGQLVGQLKSMIGVASSLKRKLGATERQRDALASIIMDKYEIHGKYEIPYIKAPAC